MPQLLGAQTASAADMPEPVVGNVPATWWEGMFARWLPPAGSEAADEPRYLGALRERASSRREERRASLQAHVQAQLDRWIAQGRAVEDENGDVDLVDVPHREARAFKRTLDHLHQLRQDR